MVLPPNRIGAVRGPNGSTLDDVVAALDALTAAVTNPVNGLPGIAAETTALLLEVQKLTGPAALPSNWPGLPVYLNSVFGTTPAALEAQQSLFGISLEAKNAAQLTQQGFFGAFPPTPAARIADLLTQQTLAATRLGAALSFLEALSLVTGDVAAAPIGSTIKDLLRSLDVSNAALLECCEGGGGGVFTPQVPTADCNGNAATYVEVPLTLKFSNSEADVYGASWPANIVQADRAFLTNYLNQFGGNQNGQYVIIALDAADYGTEVITACVAWHFSPDSGFLRATKGEGSLAESYIPFNQALTDPVQPAQSTEQLSWQAYNQSLLKPNGAAMNFAFAPGSTVVGKVWVATGTLGIIS